MQAQEQWQWHCRLIVAMGTRSYYYFDNNTIVATRLFLVPNKVMSTLSLTMRQGTLARRTGAHAAPHEQGGQAPNHVVHDIVRVRRVPKHTVRGRACQQCHTARVVDA